MSRSLKAALMRTFEEIGGEDELVAWAKVNPGEFYKMWVKWLPRTIRGDAEHPVSFKVVFSPCGQEVDDLPQIERGGEFRESREER